ncbi:MAG: hypothetical protein Q8T04_00205 [Bacteroidota bacterium]|nr:hypothetical protein [Bacteroidota bacterium]
MKSFFFHLIILSSILFSGVNCTAANFLFAPKIDSIQLVFDDQQLILPRESFRIGIISYYKNGKVRKTVGLSGGNVWWLRYKVEVSGGTDFSGRISVNEELIKGELLTEFNNGQIRICSDLRNSRESENFQFLGKGGLWKNGRFTIEPDFTLIENHRSSLIVNSLRNKSVTDTFSVLLDYKHMITVRSEGGSGGMHGSGGSGGHGGRGGYGNPNGSSGLNGQSGPSAIGWAESGRSGQIRIQSTEEFFTYTPKD